MKPRAPGLELHIDELVLRGFPPGDCAAVARAIQQELERLVTDGYTSTRWSQSATIAVADGHEFQVAPGATARQIGAQVARGIHAGIGARGPGA